MGRQRFLEMKGKAVTIKTDTQTLYLLKETEKFIYNLGKNICREYFIVNSIQNKYRASQKYKDKLFFFFTIRQKMWTLHKKRYMIGEYAPEKVLDSSC